MVGLVAQMEKGLGLQVGILKHTSFSFIIPFIIRATSLPGSFSLHIAYTVPLTKSAVAFIIPLLFQYFENLPCLKTRQIQPSCPLLLPCTACSRLEAPHNRVLHVVASSNATWGHSSPDAVGAI